jgi:hypothetical protein
MKDYNVHINADIAQGIKRRDFLRLTGLAASGIALSPWALGASSPVSTSTDWPEAAYNYITPIFLLHSTGRLALGSAFIHAGLKHSMSTDILTIVPGNSYRLGALVPFTRKELIPNLEKLKTAMHAGKSDQSMAQKLALILGAFCHQSAMEQLKTVNPFDAKSPSGNLECRVYQDAAVINHNYSKRKPMGEKETRELQSLFRQMSPRTFTRFHTIMPDDVDGAAWIMNTAKWRTQSDAYFGELASAIAQPDATKVKKYITDPNFLNGADTILKRVSSFAKVSEINPTQANGLVESGMKGSAMARALASAYHAVITINDFFGGTVQLSELESKLKL